MVCTQKKKGEMRLQRSTGGNKEKGSIYEDRRCERKADVDAKGIALLKGAS